MARLDAVIDAAYLSAHYAHLGDNLLLDCICRIETRGRELPAAILAAFRREAESRGLVAQWETKAQAPRAAAYKAARRLIRDNGTSALNWLPARIAGALRYLANQLPDDLAEKEAFCRPGAYRDSKHSPVYGNRWRKHPDIYQQAKQDAQRIGRRFAVFARTEKALSGGAAC